MEICMNNKPIILPQIVSVGFFDTNMINSETGKTAERKVEKFELELTECSGGTSFIGDNSYEVTANCCICAKPGQKRHSVFPFSCYYVHLCADSAMSDLLMNIPDFSKNAFPKAIKSLFLEIISSYAQGADSNNLYLQSKLLELIYRFSSNRLPESNSFLVSDSIISASLSYIDAHLTENLSLELLASKASLSPVYFHKRFTSALNMTPHEYILKKRLQKAKILLISTNMPISSISYDCAFSSQSYFSYIFKKTLGKTPAEYTKLAIENHPDLYV